VTWDTQRDLTNNGPTKPAPLLISTATNAGEMEVEATVEAFHAKETDVETMEAGTMVIMEDGIMVTMEDSTMVIMEDGIMATMEDSTMVIMEVGTMVIMVTMEDSTMGIMEDGIMATMEGSTMGDLLGMKAILHQLDKSVQIVDEKKYLFIHET